MSKYYAYTRVSTDKQSTDTQHHDIVSRYPHAEIIEETASSVKSRPKLMELLARLRGGDTLIVGALDRLGRKTSEILSLVESLRDRGVNIVALREGLDYSTPAGKLVWQVLVSVSELERSLIAARTKAAMGALKARGVRLGRPVKYGSEVNARIIELRAEGATYKAISEATGVSAGHLAKVLAAA